jgi:hypothetical protein
MQVVNKQFRKCNCWNHKIGNVSISKWRLPYWQGNAVADDWGLCAGHFGREKKDMFCLLTLNRSGFRYQQSKTMALLPQYGNDLAQAYRLYTLAASA